MACIIVIIITIILLTAGMESYLAQQTESQMGQNNITVSG